MMDPEHSANPQRPASTADGGEEVFVFPASFAQQRLWFLDQWEPGSSAYNVPIALRLLGPLDLDVLERSLNTIVSRHEVLRTSFDTRDGRPVQVVTPRQTVAWRVVDLTKSSDREAQARHQVTQEAHEPFDLSRGPLLRAMAVRLGDEDHVVVITIHHIVFDGWSMSVFLRELGTGYEAIRLGAPVSLPALPIQYADYTLWQQEWLQRETLDAQLAYWRQQLGDATPLLELPTDRPRSATLVSRGAHYRVKLPRALTDEVLALGRQERATLYMTLLAAFQTLLFRCAGQDDIRVGSPIAGRNQVELEGLIGLFVNTLVLRTDFSGDPTFREVLRRVRTVTLDAYAHQDVPFEKLVEELQPERSMSHAPLCQAIFVLQNTPRHALQLHDLTIVPYELSPEAAKFDVTLSLHESPEGLSGVFAYNTDLFDERTIARMAGRFERLLRAGAQAPDTRVSELELLDEAERHQILVEWNDTKTSYPRNDAVHVLFENQAKRAPEATAIVARGDLISYVALNARANQIARGLQARGVGSEATVGICLERSIDTIAGVLGVLKAGAAYVPLDANDPPERLRFMVQDSGARLIIAHAATVSRLPVLEGVDCLNLDVERQSLAALSADNLDLETGAEHLAYVMYTSGSTGTPKAVAVVHRGIVRLVKGANYVRLGPDEVMLQAAPITFDASTFEIWGALLNGARLVLANADKPSLAELGETIGRHGVTIAWLTSGLFSQMVDYEFESLRHVRQLLAGGDVLSVSHVRKYLQEIDSGGVLINGYGPTENTTFSCCHRMAAGTTIEGTVPIGRPISNTRVYVLDSRLTSQPIGVPGELYVGGDGLARGYWNSPELTAARFVTDPFCPEPGARLYRTGDRVRYRSDGTLEFLGRFDNQVKIRGYRVEPEEIQAALARHPDVREAVVVVQEGSAGDKRLVAYVALRKRLEMLELRRHLDQHVPDYMVPNDFVVLEELPKAASGKIDRRSLPAPGAISSDLASAATPRNDVEAALVGLWREVLGRERIGIHDNFFELGGHSLLATQVISRIGVIFGTKLPLRALFEVPTVAGLAARLAPGQVDAHPGTTTVLPESAGATPAVLVPLKPEGRKTPFFCVHGIGGGVQPYISLARLLDEDRPFYGLRIPPVLPTENFPSIEELAALYVQELRRVFPTGPYLLGGYSLGATVAFEMAQQLTAAGQEVPLVAALDSGLPNNRRRVRGPRALAEFVRNTFWWIADDLMRTDRRMLAARLGSKWALLAARLSHFPGLGWLPHRQPDIRDVLGVTAMPEDWGPFLEQHYKSFRAYVPRVYPGRVTLFRARALSLRWLPSRQHERDFGWGRMAHAGAGVYVIPGTHDTILREPCVASLANALRRALEEAERTRANLSQVA